MRDKDIVAFDFPPLGSDKSGLFCNMLCNGISVS